MDRNQVVEIVERQMPPVRLQRVGDPSRTRVLVAEDGFAIRQGAGRAQPLTAEAVPRLLNFVGLPKGVAERLQARTLERTATELIASMPSFSVATLEGQVTDLVKADHPALPAERVVREAEKAVKGMEFHRVHVLEPHQVRIECVGVQERPVHKGDLIRAGALLHFSPLGTIEPVVQSYGLRLVCTNGQMAEEIIQNYRRQRGGGGGEGDEIWQWFRESVREAYGSLGQVVDRYRALERTSIPARDRAASLSGLLQQAGIRGAMAEAVRAYALEHPPRNEYELYNILTYASSHILDDPREIARAQRAGAQYTTESAHRLRCPTCRRSR